MARPIRQHYFWLAARLGRSVRELLATVDADEITEWIAARRLGVFDDTKQLREVVDYVGAGICATIANVNRGADSSPYGVYDFTLFSEKPERDLADLEAEIDAVFSERAV